MEDILKQFKKDNFDIDYNLDFLRVLGSSFETYLRTSARSNEKLKILHGFISKTIQNLLGYQYKIHSLGFGDDKEAEAPGRYMDKKVDITIAKNEKIVAGIAVKFVMSNYSQNSNNYFENMLGETANLRSNKIPYYQVFIIPDKVPYYDKDGNINRWEEITQHNLDKYINLSNDNIDAFMHTPNKTFVGVVHIPDAPWNVKNFSLYKQFYLANRPQFSYSPKQINFGQTIIYNDFSDYIKKVAHSILSY